MTRLARSRLSSGRLSVSRLSGFRLGGLVDLIAPTFDAPTYVDETQTLTIPSLSEGGTLVWATSVTGNTPTYSIAGSPPGTWGGDATHETGSVSGVTTLDTPTIPVTDTTPDGTQNLRVYIYDAAGNLSAPFDVTITVDNTAPTVTFSPADDATGVSTTAPLVMNFNKSMDTSVSTTVTLKEVGGATIETYDSSLVGTWSTDTNPDDTWEVTPSSDLPGGVELAVQYSGFEDTFGNALPDATDDTTWSFEAIDEAADYISGVEADDGQALEAGVVTAVENFVAGMKADASGVAGKSNWDQVELFFPGFIGRTLAGSQRALKGSVTTNSGFTLAHYDRELGFIGNETRYLRFDRTGTEDPVDNNHMSFYATENNEISGTQVWYGAYQSGSTDSNGMLTVGPTLFVRVKGVQTDTGQTLNAFVGFSQDASGSEASNNGAEFSVTGGSASTPGNIEAFYPTQTIRGMNSRMVCMSAGGSVDLTAMRQRVTTFVADVQAAIV